MDILAEINNYITGVVKSVENSVNGTTVNLKNIEQRNEVINELTDIKSSLDNLLKSVSENLNNLQEMQTRELEEMYAFIGKMRNETKPAEETDTWSKVVRNKSKTPKRPTLILPRTIPNTETAIRNHISEGRQYNSVNFTNSLAISVIKVNSFSDVLQDGELYYVEPNKHFAFRLAGKLFHGNIGVIYTEEKNPVKIKNCRFENKCIKRDKCDYYHDPVKYPQSADCRNYIASSWTYCPPDTHFKNRLFTRRFGSLEHLETDISEIQDDDSNRFYDQTMHDVLCSLLLMNYRC